MSREKSRTKKRTKCAQKGGMSLSDLLKRFIVITNAINCIEKFSYYETAFIELQRILKEIQTQTSNVLTLTMHFTEYSDMYGIFPNNEATVYGYLLHSFRKNYVFLLEKYTQETDRNKKLHLHCEISKFYNSYMILFMYFFLEYLTDKEKKHSADFEHNTQLMCSEFPKLIQDIQEYLKKVIPNQDILNTLSHICTPVTEIKLEESMNDIPIGTFLSKSKSRSRKSKSRKYPRLIAWPEEDNKQSRIEISKKNRVVSVPIVPVVPEQFIDEDGNVLFPFNNREPQNEDRFPKRHNSRGGIQRKTKKQQKKKQK